MAEKEKYLINIQGQLIEVSPDVYYVYFRMRRQEQWQEEKKKEHKVLSYDALDTGESQGIENIEDTTAPTMEEIVSARELRDRVRNAIALLPKAERELIQAIYYNELSEREVAAREGVSQNKINKQRQKILSKLKLILDISGGI